MSLDKREPLYYHQFANTLLTCHVQLLTRSSRATPPPDADGEAAAAAAEVASAPRLVAVPPIPDSRQVRQSRTSNVQRTLRQQMRRKHLFSSQDVAPLPRREARSFCPTSQLM